MRATGRPQDWNQRPRGGPWSTPAPLRHTAPAVCELGEGLSPDSDSAGALTLDPQPPELGETNACCL